MKSSTPPDLLHYDSKRSCCESPLDADLFPDLERLKTNKINRGRIASIYLQSFGIGLQKKELTVDEEAWSEYVKHPNFRSCYDLSMAKLALKKIVLTL